MRKVVIHRWGGYDRLRLEAHEMPAVGPGQVRIAVAAIGVNYADCVVRMGLYSSARKLVGWPITPGFEVAGHIDALGANVDDLTVGEPVMAVTFFGGYATAIVVPRHQVFAVPPGFSLLEAAAFPAVHLTAWYALDLAAPSIAATLLVHSAAGGVGSALTGMAATNGWRVIGVVGRAHKVEHVRSQGADVVIDKSTEPLWRTIERVAPRGLDAIFDANGPSTLRESYRHLAPAGRLVVYGFHSMLPQHGGRARWANLALQWLRLPRFDPLKLTEDNRSVMGFNLSYLFHRDDRLAEAMADLLGRVDRGELRPPVTTHYPLTEVASAHRDLESGETIGKLVLVP